MSYDFENILNRESVFSLKYNKNYKDYIGLSIADMDYSIPVKVQQELLKRINHNEYGYTDFKQYDSITPFISFKKDLFDLDINYNDVLSSLNPSFTLNILIELYSEVGDSILLCTPTYNNLFINIIKANRNVVESKMLLKDNRYNIDYDTLEKEMQKKEIKIFVFCSPNNPSGIVWSKEDINKLVKLSEKYDKLIIFDEIYSDILNKGVKFYSAYEVESNNVAILYSNSKTFNLPSLPYGYLITRSKDIKNKFKERFNQLCLRENIFNILANNAAFNYGKSWLLAVTEKINENKILVQNKIKEYNFDINIIKNDASFILWLNIKKDANIFIDKLLKEKHVSLNSGLIYGKDYNTFVRMNVATSTSNLIEALNRIKDIF